MWTYRTSIPTFEQKTGADLSFSLSKQYNYSIELYCFDTGISGVSGGGAKPYVVIPERKTKKSSVFDISIYNLTF